MTTILLDWVKLHGFFWGLLLSAIHFFNETAKYFSIPLVMFRSSVLTDETGKLSVLTWINRGRVPRPICSLRVECPFWLLFPPEHSRLPHRLSLGYLETSVIRVYFLRIVAMTVSQSYGFSLLVILCSCLVDLGEFDLSESWTPIWRARATITGSVNSEELLFEKNYVIGWLSSFTCSWIIVSSNHHMAGW